MHLKLLISKYVCYMEKGTPVLLTDELEFRRTHPNSQIIKYHVEDLYHEDDTTKLVDPVDDPRLVHEVTGILPSVEPMYSGILDDDIESSSSFANPTHGHSVARC